jgi:CDP-diacylglycerol--glycerol-3-phosphate 3-phosphatidyltransferase
VTIVILARELAVTALRFWVIRRGVIAASRGGKIKTMLQIVAISLYILPGDLGLARELFMGAAVVATVVTGVDYAVRAVRLHRAVPHPAGPVTAPGPARPAARTTGSVSAVDDSASGEPAASEAAAGPDSSGGSSAGRAARDAPGGRS